MRIVNPIVEKRIKGKVRFSLRKIKAIKPKPFHRINKRTRRDVDKDANLPNTKRTSRPSRPRGKSTRSITPNISSQRPNPKKQQKSIQKRRSIKKAEITKKTVKPIHKRTKSDNVPLQTKKSTRFSKKKLNQKPKRNTKTPVKKTPTKRTKKSAISKKQIYKPKKAEIEKQKLSFKKPKNTNRELKGSKSNQNIQNQSQKSRQVNHHSTTDFSKSVILTRGDKEEEEFDLFQKIEGAIKTAEIIAKHARTPSNATVEIVEEIEEAEPPQDEAEIESISTEIRKVMFDC